MRPRTRFHAGLWVVTALVLLGAAVPATAQAAPPTSQPTITSPTSGTVVNTASVDVSADTVNDGTVSAVRFVLDGRAQYTVDVPVVAGVASGSLPVLGLGGSYQLLAYDCTTYASGVASECNDSGSAPVGVTIAVPAPVVTAPAAGTVVALAVVVSATAPGPAVQFLVDDLPAAVDTTAPFSASLKLSALPDGTHYVSVRQCDATGEVCEGDTSAAVAIVKDTEGPQWFQVQAAPRTVYPVRDGYRDTTHLSAQVSERATDVRLVLRNHAGRTVRTWQLGTRRAGTVGVTFDGRTAGGRVLPNGRYTFRFSGSDVDGRRSSSAVGTVVVSDKRLVSARTTRTVTAYDSGVKVFAGACSGLYRLARRGPKPYLPKGIGYYSNSKCHGGSDASLAAVAHGLKLLPAVRYGAVQIEAYGAAASRHGGPAVIAYYTSSGQLVSGSELGRPLAWHPARRVGLTPLVSSGYLFWLVGTTHGHWYNVGSFRITYMRSVLRSS